MFSSYIIIGALLFDCLHGKVTLSGIEGAQ